MLDYLMSTKLGVMIFALLLLAGFTVYFGKLITLTKLKQNTILLNWQVQGAIFVMAYVLAPLAVAYPLMVFPSAAGSLMYPLVMQSIILAMYIIVLAYANEQASLRSKYLHTTSWAISNGFVQALKNPYMIWVSAFLSILANTFVFATLKRIAVTSSHPFVILGILSIALSFFILSLLSVVYGFNFGMHPSVAVQIREEKKKIKGTLLSVTNPWILILSGSKKRMINRESIISIEWDLDEEEII